MAGDTQVIRAKMDSCGLGGLLWVMGWLFTIGYLHLPVAKAIFAIVLWPYYIGAALHH
jgi:hypothetical protein